MDLFTHIYHHFDKKLSDIQKTLNRMATRQEFQNAFNKVNEALANIGDDITRLTQQLSTSGLSEAEEAQILAELTALGDRAKDIANRSIEDDETTSTSTTGA